MSDTRSLALPDITPAQIIAGIGTVVGLLVSNLLIDAGTAKLITDLAAIVVPAVFLVADAIIRHGRSQIAAAQVIAGEDLRRTRASL